MKIHDDKNEKENYKVIKNELEIYNDKSSILGINKTAKSIFECPKGIESLLGIGNTKSSILGINKTAKSIFERPKGIESLLGIGNTKSSILGINKTAKSIFECSKYMEKELESLNFIEEIKKIDFNSVKVNTNGTISYSDTVINIEDEIIETINEINSDANNDISYEERFSSFFTKIKVKHPIVIFIITMFLIAPFYEYYIDCAKTIINSKIKKVEIKNNTYTEKNKFIKDIKKEVVAEANLNYYNDKNLKKALGEYRFVKVDCLNVRISDCTNSRMIYNLKFGDVVKILKKNKNWTLIEYIVDENIIIKGWVYTRYISEFK